MPHKNIRNIKTNGIATMQKKKKKKKKKKKYRREGDREREKDIKQRLTKNTFQKKS